MNFCIGVAFYSEFPTLFHVSDSVAFPFVQKTIILSDTAKVLLHEDAERTVLYCYHRSKNYRYSMDVLLVVNWFTMSQLWVGQSMIRFCKVVIVPSP